MRLGILLLILVIAIAIRLGLFERLMKTAEGYAGLSAAHDRYVADSTQKVSSVTSLLNLTHPVLPIDRTNTSNLGSALSTAIAIPQGAATYGLQPVTSPLTSRLPNIIELAHACEASPKTCAAFDDPTFAANCGMSFDPNGTAMDGHVVVGSGLYVSPNDRTKGLTDFEHVQTHGSAPYDPYLVARPTLGTAKAGTFALDKNQCTVVKEKLDCASKQTFGVSNCTQCYTTQSFSRIGPQTGRLPSTLHLFGAGRVAVSSPDDVSMNARDLSTTDASLELPAHYEGHTFTVTLTDNGTHPLWIGGWLEGPTSRGTFKVDMLTLVKIDTQTGARPRLSGSQTMGGFRATSMIPGTGKTGMTLTMYMPFTFINGFDGDSLACENGPVITLADSATFLESDPCYGKANQPGNYKMECLQSRWTELGGTPQGTGWPRDPVTMNAVQQGSDGRALTIDDIADQLGAKAARAYGGTDEAGRPLSIADWNAVSMEMTGVPINTPCDGPANAAGTPSPSCLTYLYTNQGVSSRIGPTYSQNPGRVASAKEAFQDAPSVDPSVELLTGGEEFLDKQFVTEMILQKKDVVQHPYGIKEGFAEANTFNYPGTAIDPATPAGQDFAKKLGSIQEAKQVYDQINRTANDNTLTNDQRRTAIQQAYGVTLGTPSSSTTAGAPQVYSVGGYTNVHDQAESVCAKYGATVATKAQLQEAQRMGADWCISGWVADDTVGQWPITTNAIPGCGSVGINRWDNGKAAVNCFGPKPDLSSPDAVNGTIHPFNAQMWTQPTEPTYLTVPNGYLETTGPQPSCFSGLSVEAAQKGCNALGDRCVGFSFSKDGKGNGCYKGNHAAGLNTNSNYMGYVKVGGAAASGPVSGRYLRLEYNHVECLNLAQILVFATKGGPNLITPSTAVTKPDGWSGDVFPVKNFVDGRGDSFVHTSCSGVPWIEVDLGKTTPIDKVVVWNRNDCCQSRVVGTVLSILDEDKAVVYLSNPITTTNMTYTWNPPSAAVRVDVAEDAKPAAKVTPWRCMNGWGAPMRKNANGDVECMSTNHHDCMWNASCNQLVNAPPSNLDPLTCGAMHAREWGMDGYSSSAHWCAIARGQIQ